MDCLVHIGTANGIERDGLVACVHYGKILDVLEPLNGHADLYPAGSPVGEVVPAFGTFIDGVGGIGEVGLHHLPSPRPGEIGQVALLLRVLIAVHCVQRCKDAWFLHVEMGFEVEQIQQEPPTLICERP